MGELACDTCRGQSSRIETLVARDESDNRTSIVGGSAVNPARHMAPAPVAFRRLIVHQHKGKGTSSIDDVDRLDR
jgi:hypothetical protein